MKFTFCALGLILSMMLVSCKNNQEESNTENIITNNADTSREINNEISAIEMDSIIKILQGKWKEPEYPFRLAHFEKSTVKFIEEGVAAEPTFQEYKISKDCSFEVNNIKNANANDIFLVMAGAKTCEILKISNDTLILNGFNVSSNSDYNIIYKKVE